MKNSFNEIKNSEGFKLFTKLCCDTFLILRKNYHGLVNLFTMMLSTGLPELKNTSDNIIITTACLGGVLNKADNDIKTEFLKFLINRRH